MILQITFQIYTVHNVVYLYLVSLKYKLDHFFVFLHFYYNQESVLLSGACTVYYGFYLNVAFVVSDEYVIHSGRSLIVCDREAQVLQQFKSNFVVLCSYFNCVLAFINRCLLAGAVALVLAAAVSLCLKSGSGPVFEARMADCLIPVNIALPQGLTLHKPLPPALIRTEADTRFQTCQWTAHRVWRVTLLNFSHSSFAVSWQQLLAPLSPAITPSLSTLRCHPACVFIFLSFHPLFAGS